MPEIFQQLGLPYNAQSTENSPSCCFGSCCAGCTSTIEKSISDRVQQLLAGGDLAQEMPFIFGGRLSCLPLSGSSFRLLKHQFRIVQDYLSENGDSKTGNRWGAVFHLRLIGARIRAARTSSTKDAASCCEAKAFDSGCCGD
jgi:hypothetical protein